MDPKRCQTNFEPGQPHGKAAHGLFYSATIRSASATTWKPQICSKFTKSATKIISNFLMAIFEVFQGKKIQF